jgi:hypothetical protein
MRRQNLDGDGTVEARVPGTINLAHTAGAYERHDFIGAQSSCGR